MLDLSRDATRQHLLEQLLGMGIPIVNERLEGELMTPTSAAAILHLVDRFEG